MALQFNYISIIVSFFNLYAIYFIRISVIGSLTVVLILKVPSKPKNFKGPRVTYLVSLLSLIGQRENPLH